MNRTAQREVIWNRDIKKVALCAYFDERDNVWRTDGVDFLRFGNDAPPDVARCVGTCTDAR